MKYFYFIFLFVFLSGCIWYEQPTLEEKIVRDVKGNWEMTLYKELGEKPFGLIGAGTCPYSRFENNDDYFEIWLCPKNWKNIRNDLLPNTEVAKKIGSDSKYDIYVYYSNETALNPISNISLSLKT